MKSHRLRAHFLTIIISNFSSQKHLSHTKPLFLHWFSLSQSLIDRARTHSLNQFELIGLLSLEAQIRINKINTQSINHQNSYTTLIDDKGDRKGQEQPTCHCKMYSRWDEARVRSQFLAQSLISMCNSSVKCVDQFYRSRHVSKFSFQLWL